MIHVGSQSSLDNQRKFTYTRARTRKILSRNSSSLGSSKKRSRALLSMRLEKNHARRSRKRDHVPRDIFFSLLRFSIARDIRLESLFPGFFGTEDHLEKIKSRNEVGNPVDDRRLLRVSGSRICGRGAFVLSNHSQEIKAERLRFVGRRWPE